MQMPIWTIEISIELFPAAAAAAIALVPCIDRRPFENVDAKPDSIVLSALGMPSAITVKMAAGTNK